jgi:monoamine oxidase
MSYVPVPPKEEHQIKEIESRIAYIISEMKKETQETLQSTLFTQYAQKWFTKEKIQEMTDSTGYYAEYTRMNAFDFLKLYDLWMRPDIQYYTLRCGMHTIIDTLVKKLSHKIDIRTGENGNVIQINRIKNDRCIAGYYVHTAKRIYKTKSCVFALPKHVLTTFSILSPLYKELRSIDEVSLCRIYSFYKTPWWKSMKMTTNTPLRMIIPIHDHLIMSSYTDDLFADAWQKKKQNADKGKGSSLEKNITRYTRKVFGKQIQDPDKSEIFYWKEGVGCWKQNANSIMLYDRILRPFPHESFYICGENYSHQQGWIEGSLETARDVCSSLLASSKTPDAYC